MSNNNNNNNLKNKCGMCQTEFANELNNQNNNQVKQNQYPRKNIERQR